MLDKETLKRRYITVKDEDFEYKGHPKFLELTHDEMRLHSEKNADYAHGGNPLGNFYRTSAIKKLYPGLDWASPAGSGLDYMLKQLDAALWMLSQGYEGEVENVDKRLRDVHVYVKLVRILLDEQ